MKSFGGRIESPAINTPIYVETGILLASLIYQRDLLAEFVENSAVLTLLAHHINDSDSDIVRPIPHCVRHYDYKM